MLAKDEDNEKRVQFPNNLSKPHPLPYPLPRYDSDAGSSRASSTHGDDSSEYDWSDEDDLVEESANFEKRMGVKTKRQGWSFKRVISVLFSSLVGSSFLACLFVAPALLVHFYWYKPHPTDHRRFVKDNVQAWLFWVAVNLPISWGLAMVVDIIPILLRYFLSAIWGHVSEAVKSKIETYNSVKDTIKPALYAASAWASWAIIFDHIYALHDPENGEDSPAQYTNRLAQVVQFFFFAILVWCVQRMLSHFIAFSFHRTAYKDRIETVEHALAVIEKLRQYRPKNQPRSGARTPVLGSAGTAGTPSALSDTHHFNLLSGALRNATPRTPPTHSRRPTSTTLNLSSIPVVEAGNEGDVEDVDRTLVERKRAAAKRQSWFQHDPMSANGSHTRPSSFFELGDQREITSAGDSPYGYATPEHHYPPPVPESRRDSPRHSVDRIEGSETALKQAAKVLKNAVFHDARNIMGKDEDDFAALAWNVNSTHEAKRLARSIWMRFKDRGRSWLIPADFYPAFPDEESAKEAFKVFDQDNNGDISRAEVKTTLIKVYRERRFLSRSMKDVGEALRTLKNMMRFFAAVVLFFISLGVFGVEIGDSISSVYTIFVAASFIFKNAASSGFDAIMFLFVTHPYDTGDRVFVNGENLVVRKVGLFATVFLRSDGTETYYFNSQLFTKFITNVRRSGKTFENLAMQVAWKTPLTKLDALEKSLNNWLSTEENRWYEPGTNVTLQHIVYQRYLELTIGIGHNGNWQDWGLRNARRTAFHAAVQHYCHELGIVGYEAPQPIVWADPKTMHFEPEPTSPFPNLGTAGGIGEGQPQRPISPATADAEAKEAEQAAKEMKASLGFLPPLADRPSHLGRARRSRNRKATLRATIATNAD